jgi:putative ABC transport system permease protein
MLRLQMLLAWRNIVKRRFYSSIEIVGLAAGMTCFMIILLHVTKETGYDRGYTDYERIYRVLNFEIGTGNRYSGGASAIGYHARTEIPQVEQVVRLFYPYRNYSTSALVQHNDIRFYEDNIIEADSNFFQVFDLTFVEGSAASALSHPNSIVLSTRAAKKYFGDKPAVGQFIGIDEELALQVSAVVDVPYNTHLDFDFLRPANHNPDQLYVWEQTLAFTYLKLHPQADVSSVEKQVYGIVLKNATNNNAEYLNNYSAQLQPIANIHTTVLQWDIIQATSSQQLMAILVIAVFILLLAIANFINLATARATERIRETGLSKILGASQSRLTWQFFTEFLVVTVFAGFLALVLTAVSIPLFNESVNTNLSLTQLIQPLSIVIFIAVVVATALLSGIYPAYRLSRFKPVQVIKRTSTANDNPRLRAVLVVFQFLISTSLLSSTFLIQDQIRFMQEADLGFDKEHIFILRLRDNARDRFDQLRNELRSHSQIKKVAGASGLLGGEPGSDTFHPDHMREEVPNTFAKNIAVNADFLDLIGVNILRGRNFQQENPSDYRTSYIINETAVKQFQLADPVGSNFRRSGDTEGKIIGVMPDFHFAKLNDRINAMVFYMDSALSSRYMFVKLQGNVPDAVAAIEGAWKTVMPEFPIEGFFQDQYFNQLYQQEQQVALITRWFSFLAIALAALGLLGMSSFIILQKTKEIGIRKVIGASVKDILVLLGSQFVKLIVIAFIVSIPVTIFLMQQWLDGFVTRISIGPIVFVVAGVITIGIALLTISVQSIKAALANPVEAIRQE